MPKVPKKGMLFTYIIFGQKYNRGDHVDVDIIHLKLPTSGGDKVGAVCCLFCVKLGHSEYSEYLIS